MSIPLALTQGPKKIHRPPRIETVAFVAFMVALKNLQNQYRPNSDAEIIRKSRLSRAALDVIQHQEGVLMLDETLAYVKACGADQDYWRHRQQDLIRTIWTKAFVLLVTLLSLFLSLPLTILTLHRATELTGPAQIVIGCGATLVFACFSWYPVFDIDWFGLRPVPDAGPDDNLLSAFSIMLILALIIPAPVTSYEWFKYSSFYGLGVYPFAGILFYIRKPVSDVVARVLGQVGKSLGRKLAHAPTRLSIAIHESNLLGPQERSEQDRMNQSSRGIAEAFLFTEMLLKDAFDSLGRPPVDVKMDSRGTTP